MPSTNTNVKATKETKKGKKVKEGGKGKGGAKEGTSKTVEGSEKEESESEEIVGETENKVRAGADGIDIAAMKAIVSINTINLLAPPRPLKFGTWNTRPLDISKGQQLLTAMKKQEFRMFKMESMIPLIMRKEDLEQDCIKTDISDGLGAEAPELKLTEAGRKRGSIYAAGGRHRHWAIEKEVGDCQKEVGRLREAIEDLETKETGSERDKKVIEDKEKEIEQLEKYQKTISKWGVIVYDEEKMRANGDELANHISRNEFEFRYVETEAKGLRMELKQYLNTEGDEEKRRRYLKKVGSESSVIGQIMNHQETRNYLIALNSLGEHFQHREVFDSKWIKENLHSIGGGIIINVVRYLTNIWHALMTPDEQVDMTDEQMTEYQRELKNPQDQRSNTLTSQSKRTWKAIARDPECQNFDMVGATDSGQKPLMDMLTTQMMKAVTELGVGGKNISLLIGGDEAEWELQWAGYTLGLKDIVEQLTETIFKKTEEQTVRDLMKKKVDWILMDHGIGHYQRRLPLLTPAVIVGYAQAMKMIPNALTEFLRWFDPFAEYCTTISRSAEHAKDLSCWVLRTISTDHDKIFRDGPKAAAHFAHFVVRHLDIFVLMEEQIKVVAIPDRPRVSQEFAPSKILAKYGDDIPVSEKDRKQMIKVMQGFKKGKVSDNSYINMKTCVDWRTIMSKKIDRDWARYMIAIILEPILVSRYRQDMFNQSPAAAYLRAMSQRLLSSHCRRPNVLLDGNQSYIFVDGIEMPGPLPAKPIINVGLVMVKTERRSNVQDMRQEVVAFVKRFDRLKAVAARPGSDLVADEVKDAFDSVVDKLVSNIYRLEAMSEELNVKSVDPLNAKWNDIAIVEYLNNVKRRDGWSTGLAKKKRKHQVEAESEDDEEDEDDDEEDGISRSQEASHPEAPTKHHEDCDKTPTKSRQGVRSANTGDRPKGWGVIDRPPSRADPNLNSNSEIDEYLDVIASGDTEFHMFVDPPLGPAASDSSGDFVQRASGSKRPAPSDFDLRGIIIFTDARPATRSRSNPGSDYEEEERETVRPQRVGTSRLKKDTKGKNKAI